MHLYLIIKKKNVFVITFFDIMILYTGRYWYGILKCSLSILLIMTLIMFSTPDKDIIK